MHHSRLAVGRSPVAEVADSPEDSLVAADILVHRQVAVGEHLAPDHSLRGLLLVLLVLVLTVHLQIDL